jgi:GntR family transcriptional regulator, transcriptional repressor for pyruvate dehydrogenase complex
MPDGTSAEQEEKSDILDRHRRLAWAIADRNPEEAQRCMAAHFDEAIGSLLRR